MDWPQQRRRAPCGPAWSTTAAAGALAVVKGELDKIGVNSCGVEKMICGKTGHIINAYIFYTPLYLWHCTIITVSSRPEGNYTADRIVVVAAGPVDHAECVRNAEERGNLVVRTSTSTSASTSWY